MFRGQGNLKINFEIEPKGVTIPVSQIKYKNIAIVVVLFVVVPDLIFPDYYYFFKLILFHMLCMDKGLVHQCRDILFYSCIRPILQSLINLNKI